MAFHFNWSPLIADTDRVRRMLTSSLNKSPKPPIIVDDIIVNELNLGSNPPSLEILEVGDLAADRFRGIFKVRYEGDAYLTLKTRVQANPLNTFLSTKPTFASPNPLAAGSSLTIPLQITLSDIRLSGFVILVFNKQKGITLVFQNDPLESLKVSSTFDSIPFVRDYLQRTIEAQLRVLFMEDLPAIIHRLSLKVFGPESENTDPDEIKSNEVDFLKAADPSEIRSAGEESVDETLIDPTSLFDMSTEMYTSFSPKSLLRLATLSESQRTLSLFTPAIEDAVYRAGANNANRHYLHDDHIAPLLHPFTLRGMQSSVDLPNQSTRPSEASSTSEGRSHLTRPSMSSLPSVATTYSLGSGRTRSHAARKRKHRVVNLRRNQDGGHDGVSDAVSESSGYEDSASRSESFSPEGSTNPISAGDSTVPTSLPGTSVHPKERDGEVHTPHASPKKRVEFEQARSTLDDVIAEAENFATLRPRPTTPRHQSVLTLEAGENEQTPRASVYVLPEKREHASLTRAPTMPEHPKHATLPRSASELSISDLVSAFPMHGGSSGGILEQAWMMKMATEIARRVAHEKEKQGAQWPDSSIPARGEQEQSDEPPPAYVS